MNCRKVRQYLFGYFRSELSAQEGEEVKAHLKSCPDCAKEAEQVQAIYLMLKGDLETLVPSPDFDQKLLAKVREVPSEVAPKRKTSWWADLLHEIFPSVRLRWALAGAVGVLVVAFAFMFSQKQTSTRPEYMSGVEQEADNQTASRPEDASDSAYADLMRRLAEGSVVANKSFVMDNASFPSSGGEDGMVPVEDLYKRFVIERTSVPARESWLDNRYVLPVVTTQQVPKKADY
jgi:anti-sigma factor RsiW